MIAVFCIIATFLSVLFAIMHRQKYPGYSILAVAIMPAVSFYVLGKYQYTEVFIGFAIFYCIFGYILTMKRILLNHSKRPISISRNRSSHVPSGCPHERYITQLFIFFFHKKFMMWKIHI